MSPRHHEDKLLAWARITKVPVVSLNYKKAPEYPYPYALNECYDTYHSIIYSRGRCVGLSGESLPKIALTGDSAGGNFAAAVTLMILNSTSTSTTGHLMEAGWKGLPLPEGVILIYPNLDLNMSSWVSEEQMKLMNQRDTIETNRHIVEKKNEYFDQASGTSRHPSTHSLPGVEDSALAALTPLPKTPTAADPTPTQQVDIATRLSMSSRLCYANDRILTLEMMRAMVILYIGPHARPDFQTDFLLSPIVAPESLLAGFPPVYFLTGERDPLVDDTVIFAGRVRAAKQAVRRHRRELGLRVRESDDVEVSLISGISHGFLQMGALFPQANREIRKCALWLNKIFEETPKDGNEDEALETDDEDANGLSMYISVYTSDEEKPLEIGGGLKGTKVKKSKSEGKGARRVKVPRGRARKGSVRSLGSQEDLMGRRMKVVANGLQGEGKSGSDELE